VTQLLAVSWEMPPLSSPRAVQVTRTLRELGHLGWSSRVVCFGPRSKRYNQDYDEPTESDGGGAVRLVRVASPEEWFFFRALWRICPPVKWLPDEKRVWVGRAIRAARETLAEAPADLIVSFGQPWSDHLIGLALHRETRLPWVAHFSDPWVDSPYLHGAAWQRRIWDRMERDVVTEASRVVFVNTVMADRVMAKYPAEFKRRARVVPQGFDASLTPVAPARRPGPLHIVYTGRFYPGVRTPDALLAALGILHRRAALDGRLAVTFVGGSMEAHQGAAARLGLNAIVTFCGRRSPTQALALASTADVLLVIDAPSDGPSLFLPSKLIDYLPLRKPVLGLTPSEGASAELLGRLGYRTVDPLDVEAIAREVDRLLHSPQADVLKVSARHDEVSAAYDIRVTTRAFEAVLREALEVVQPT
jgi:glycosyltransferase involved in cell wall biosynthesis